MEIGRDDEPECPNMWPDNFDDEGKEFKSVMLSFFAQCKQLHIAVMRAIAVGIGLPDASYFDSFTDRGDNTLRLLHYPPVPASAFSRAGTVRAGEHTDYGSITLLFQDAAGGLQVQSPQGTFVDATPIPDTIVVNAGDLLARWSSDSIRSTKHRVVQPPLPPTEGEDGTYPARYSIAYFCNPNFDRYIDAIPGTMTAGGETGKKYEGVYSGEYLERRLAATY
jgi:isopenicillin N synthase-like dioxygenase